MSTDRRSSESLRYDFRRATTFDAAMIAEAAARMFVQTFGADNDPRDMSLYLPSAFGESLQRAEIDDSSCTYLVANHDDALIAFALLREGSRHASVNGDAPVEIQRFYVEQAYHGRGLAVQLMSACLTTAVDAGGRTAWLAVWERNARAIRFYEKSGFVDVGSHHFLLGTDRQSDRVMMRAIGPLGAGPD